jgi:hypothetical protein
MNYTNPAAVEAAPRKCRAAPALRKRLIAVRNIVQWDL